MDRRYSMGGGVKSPYGNGFNSFSIFVFLNFCRTIFKKALAFTLAETLIVMGIIGVVAALTLPNLNSSTGNKEKVAKLQKIYSNLNDAYGRATAVYGPYETWFLNDGGDSSKIAKRAFQRMTEFMKYSKECIVSDGCSETMTYNTTSGLNVNYGVVLADGTTVWFVGNSYSMEIFVDLDGLKGKNKYCIDRFAFFASQVSGLRPSSTAAGDTPKNPNLTSGEYDTLYICADWVISTGNMDYLKTIDLNNTCPDGKTVLNRTTNITCK
ncbi:type II secretion system protein [bacterium]|nr:type II secretion system protein [bacterium]